MQPQSRRAVYIVESPLSERDAARFGLEILQQHGFAVEAWEVDALFLPNSRKQVFVPAVGWTVWSIASVDELRQRCAGLSAGDVVISLCGYYRGQGGTYAPLRQALSASPARVAAISVGVRAVRRISWRGVARSSLRRPRLALADLRTLAARRLERIRTAPPRSRSGQRSVSSARVLDWLFVATVTSDVDPACIGSTTSIVPIHSFDYDLVLQQNEIPAIDGEYLLFLDSMGPLHPDYDTLGLERGPTTPDDYFAILRGILLKVEELTGVPVRVAAHPRAPVGLLEPLYGERPVVYGQTAALLASARGTLMAFPSTAIGMAVAYRRPMTLIVSERFDPFVREEAAIHVPLLHMDVIDADRPLMSWKVPEVSTDAYSAYETRFVKSPDSPSLPFWEVVARTITSNGQM